MTLPRTLEVVHTVASTRADHGGPSRSVPFLCEALAEQGASVRLITAVPEDVSDETSAILPADPVESHVIEERGWVSRTLRAPVGFYRTLREQVAQHRPHILHDHGAWLPSNGAAALVAHQFDIPLVVSTRGMLTSWALNHNRLKKKLAWFVYQKRVLRQAALFHVTSTEERHRLRELGFDQPAALIPNGVQIPDSVQTGKPEDSRCQALFLSRLHPKKGLPMLIEAWAKVRPDGWKLTLVGPSENGHRGELEEQVRRNKLSDVVTFTGPVSDEEKWSFYRSADLFVLPTYSENFGIVVAESLASEVPVLTTTGTPWKELETHECGWWVDPNAEALTDALKEAMDLSAEERHEMGRRGRTLVEKRYSWQGVAEQMRMAYHWLLTSGALPSCIQLK